MFAVEHEILLVWKWRIYCLISGNEAFVPVKELMRINMNWKRKNINPTLPRSEDGLVAYKSNLTPTPGGVWHYNMESKIWVHRTVSDLWNWTLWKSLDKDIGIVIWHWMERQFIRTRIAVQTEMLKWVKLFIRRKDYKNCNCFSKFGHCLKQWRNTFRIAARFFARMSRIITTGIYWWFNLLKSSDSWESQWSTSPNNLNKRKV